MNTQRSSERVTLVAGDLITLALVTVYGFASHGELMTAGPRMLTTFIPLVIGWLAAGPVLGAYDLEQVHNPRHLWRPFWAMILGGPLAVGLRGLWLFAPIIPTFLLVMTGVSALGILAWRVIFWFLTRRTDGRVEQTYG